MSHLVTYPDVFIANQTYIPVNWDLKDLPEKLDEILSNYNYYQQVAQYGQSQYKNVVNNSELFIQNILQAFK